MKKNLDNEKSFLTYVEKTLELTPGILSNNLEEHLEDIEEWDSYIVHFKSSRPPQDTPEQEFDYRTYERGYGKLVDRYLNV